MTTPIPLTINNLKRFDQQKNNSEIIDNKSLDSRSNASTISEIPTIVSVSNNLIDESVAKVVKIFDSSTGIMISDIQKLDKGDSYDLFEQKKKYKELLSTHYPVKVENGKTYVKVTVVFKASRLKIIMNTIKATLSDFWHNCLYLIHLSKYKVKTVNKYPKCGTTWVGMKWLKLSERALTPEVKIGELDEINVSINKLSKTLSKKWSKAFARKQQGDRDEAAYEKLSPEDRKYLRKEKKKLKKEEAKRNREAFRYQRL